MAGTTSDWRDELGHWLRPFLDRLGHKARRQMCPLYVAGLIGPGDRKSVQPMAERFAPGDYDQLHHFVSAGVWETRLCRFRHGFGRLKRVITQVASPSVLDLFRAKASALGSKNFFFAIWATMQRQKI
jgi:hypothetical protein